MNSYRLLQILEYGDKQIQVRMDCADDRLYMCIRIAMEERWAFGGSEITDLNAKYPIAELVKNVPHLLHRHGWLKLVSEHIMPDSGNVWLVFHTDMYMPKIFDVCESSAKIITDYIDSESKRLDEAFGDVAPKPTEFLQSEETTDEKSNT